MLTSWINVQNSWIPELMSPSSNAPVAVLPWLSPTVLAMIFNLTSYDQCRKSSIWDSCWKVEVGSRSKVFERTSTKIQNFSINWRYLYGSVVFWLRLYCIRRTPQFLCFGLYNFWRRLKTKYKTRWDQVTTWKHPSSTSQHQKHYQKQPWQPQEGGQRREMRSTSMRWSLPVPLVPTRHFNFTGVGLFVSDQRTT